MLSVNAKASDVRNELQAETQLLKETKVNQFKKKKEKNVNLSLEAK